MLKLFAFLFIALSLTACNKGGTTPCEMGTAAAGGAKSIGDYFTDLSDQARSGVDQLSESANQTGKDWGASMRRSPATTTPGSTEIHKAIVACAGHPMSKTRIITSKGEKHFTADTGEECQV